MNRTVFDNDGVAHAWAQNNRAEGRSGNGNFFFHGPALWSYGNHFLVGHILPDGVALLNADSYSVSTSRHQSTAAGAVSHREKYRLDGLTGLGDALRCLSALGDDERVGLGYLERSELRDRARREIRRYCEEHADRLAANYHHDGAEGGNLDALTYLLRLVGLERSRQAVLRKHARDQERAARRRDQEAEARKEREARDLVADTFARSYFSARLPWRAALAEMAKDGNAQAALGDLSKRLFRAQKWTKGRKGWKRAHDTLKARRAEVREILGRLEAMQARAWENRETRLAISVLREIAQADLGAGYWSHRLESFALGGPHGGFHGGQDAQAQNADREAEEVGILAEARALRNLAAARPVAGSIKARAQARLGEIATRAEEIGQERRARATRKAEEREAERLERERAAREAWISGQPGARRGYWRDAQGGAYLRAVGVTRDESGRITGGTLETSQGADVPLTHALRVFRFLKWCRETGRDWRRNGSTIRVGFYQVDSVDLDGSFRAGCHRINWPEVERLAAALGVADLEADSTVATRHAAA